MQKKRDFKRYQKYLPLAVCLVLLATKVLASGSDPFALAEEKGQDIQEGIMLIGGIFTSIVVTVAGMACMMGKLGKEWMIRIIAGAVIIGGGGTAVSAWLIG